MKTTKNLFWTGIALSALYWIVTQGDTTDIGKIIRLIVWIGCGYMWLTRTTWGTKVRKGFGDE